MNGTVHGKNWPHICTFKHQTTYEVVDIENCNRLVALPVHRSTSMAQAITTADFADKSPLLFYVAGFM